MQLKAIHSVLMVGFFIALSAVVFQLKTTVDHQSAEQLQSAAYSSFAINTATSSNPNLGAQNTIVIITAFSDDPYSPATTTRTDATDNFNEMAQFISRNSYGQSSLTGGRVFGPYITGTGASVCTLPTFDQQIQEVVTRAIQRADQESPIPDNSNVLLFHSALPCIPVGNPIVRTISTSHGAVTVRGVRIPGSKIYGEGSWALIHHEWGHLAGAAVPTGIGHTENIFCGIDTSSFFGSNCTKGFLGINAYDVMEPTFMLINDYSAAVKRAIGWLKNSMVVVAQQGTFQISSLESVDDGGLKVINIPLTNKPIIDGTEYQELMVEYRQVPTRLAQYGASGVVIHAVGSTGIFGTLSIGTNANAVPLRVGRVYTFGTHNPSLRIESITNGKATITVIPSSDNPPPPPPPPVVPIVSTISPLSGLVGTQVTLTGSGFTATGNSVRIGSYTISNLNALSNSISFTIPLSMSAGSYQVSVVNANGTSNALSFTVTAPNPPPPPSPPPVAPHIDSITPSTGSAGTSVTLTGTGFTSIGTNVLFGRTVISPSSRTANPLVFMVPNPITEGVYSVAVTNSNGTSNAVSFTVGAPPQVIPPTITLLYPKSGGTWVKGTNQNITWQCTPGTEGCAGSLTYDIKLIACGSLSCSTTNTVTYYIAKNLIATSYGWNVGKVIVQGNIMSDTAPDGTYRLQVCVAGSTTCDTSNTTLTLISNTAK